MSDQKIGNEQVADLLDRVATLLEMQEKNRYRVQSYRRAARAVRQAQRPVAELLDEKGLDGLQGLRGVGEKLAGAIREIVETGHLGLLDRLEEEVSPGASFARVPGIGEEIAARIRDTLGVETLEELEMAAHDGRLKRVEGLGEQRIQGIRDALAGMLGRSERRRARLRQEGRDQEAEQRAEPPPGLILGLDREYREKAEAGTLKTIAPRRFNPQGEAWLPIMEVERRGWTFTLLFSNTARAHELDKTRDWVVVYYKDGGVEDQCTVVTATSGPLRGKRVIRGRERQCRDYYRQASD
ncbi:MAG: helix-hairpin-helix domain-containing protein [bacterium]